jgi:hypothetical protein
MDEDEVVLQDRMNGLMHLSLLALVDDEGDFMTIGSDDGKTSPDSERTSYGWEFTVAKKDVPAVVALLGGKENENILDIVRRDWVPVEGEGLERKIRESGIEYTLYVDRD